MGAKLPGYSAVLPMQLVLDENITSSAIRVYAVVYGFCNYYGKCTVSNRHIAEKLHTTERNIIRLVAQLCDRGYLEARVDDQTNTKSGMSSRTIWLKNCKFSAEPHDKNVTPPPDKNVTLIINKYNNTPYSPPEGDGARNTPEKSERKKSGRGRMPKDEHGNVILDDIQERMFELFWKNYPRKDGKQAARRAWWKQNPDIDLLKTMLMAIERLKETEQWRDRNIIPHAATWLNNSRWLDAEELPDPGAGDNGGNWL